MMHRIKNTAITYTGYEYQTLFGVKMMAEWINSPNLYTRVLIEADSVETGIPEGIDDPIERLMQNICG